MNQPGEDNWDMALKPFRPVECPVDIGSSRIGDGSLSLIAGPCAIESEDLCLRVAEHLNQLCNQLGITYIFKSSFDKANRTSVRSFRGNGFESGLRILEKVKEVFGVPVLTDVHETNQVSSVAQVADVLQIPAFLCRQTDLLVECGESGRLVNIKKGQFLAPEDMRYAVEKVQEGSDSGNKALITERGALFGYRDLVVDMRSLVIMREVGCPVVFDATHSVQQMGAVGGASGGRTEFIPAQLRAAVSVGIDALFIETHPNPAQALSDGTNMIPLKHMEKILKMALAVHGIHSL